MQTMSTGTLASMLLPKRVRAKLRMPLHTRCWEWQGATRPGGYGHLSVKGRTVSAHRYVYELLVGPIPEGMELDHLCDNPYCVKPGHLEPVTPEDHLRRTLKRRKRLGTKWGKRGEGRKSERRNRR